MSDSRPVLLFVIPSLGMGGAERVFSTLLAHLDPKQFRLRLAVVSLGAKERASSLPPHVEVIDLGARRVLTGLPRLIALMHRDPPDLVVSTLDHLNIVLAASRVFWPRRVRHVIRATHVVTLGMPRFRFAMRMFYRKADGIVFQSEDMAEAYRDAIVHLPGARISIGNPVDITRVRRMALEGSETAFGCGEPQLVSVGRLDPLKGFDLLIRAVALMTSRVSLSIVGEGVARAELERLIEELGLSGRVRLLGARANPYPIVAAADGFVLSSRSEGFPNTVLEALALGTPVIATPVSGLDRFLAGMPSTYVARNISVHAIAEALEAFCAHRGCRVPADVVDSFDAGVSAAKYARFFHEVLAQAA